MFKPEWLKTCRNPVHRLFCLLGFHNRLWPGGFCVCHPDSLTVD